MPGTNTSFKHPMPFKKKLSTLTVSLVLGAVGVAVLLGCKCDNQGKERMRNEKLQIRTEVAPLKKIFNLASPIIAARWAVQPRDMPGWVPGEGGWTLYAWVDIAAATSKALPRSATPGKAKFYLPRKIAEVVLPPGVAEPIDSSDSHQDALNYVKVRGDAVDDETARRLLFKDGKRQGGVLRLGDHLFLCKTSQ
jgi:hypothetical protein